MLRRGSASQWLTKARHELPERVTIERLSPDWMRALRIVAFAVAGRGAFRAFAAGYAEGRNSVELASSIEYVHGRIPPRTPDYIASGVIIGLTHLLPIAALLYALLRF